MGKAGRPSKWKNEFLETTREYLEGGYETHKHIIPSVVGLAMVLEVTRETINNWTNEGHKDDASEEKQEFADLMARLNQAQEMRLLAGGLGGTFNSTITKLVLAKHGYVDKVDHGFDPDKPAKFVLNMGKKLDKGEDDE